MNRAADRPADRARAARSIGLHEKPCRIGELHDNRAERVFRHP